MWIFKMNVQHLLKDLAPDARGQRGAGVLRIWQYFHILPRPTINTPLKHHNSYSNIRGKASRRSAWLDSGCNNWLRN